MIRRTSLFAAAALAAAGLAFAQPPATAPKKTEQPKAPKATTDAALTVGSKAPEIKVSNWVKGSEVKSFASGKAYVVEFWATWCGPCKKSIPHLNELAKAHKDLTVVGVSVWEYTHKKSLTDVQQFVKEKGDGMSYTVAYDGEKFMEKNWMQAAGRSGIPSAFVIGGDGKIAWIGNPLADDFTAAVESALKTAGGSAAKPTEKPKG